MSSYPIEVINHALRAHDPECLYWLEQVKALLDDPANRLHRKALEKTKQYLEDVSGDLNAYSATPGNSDCH